MFATSIKFWMSPTWARKGSKRWRYYVSQAAHPTSGGSCPKRVTRSSTGRTDFQNGDSRAQYESLQRLMRRPEETLVFPAHDYKGDTVSTIGEEKRFNPRLQVRDAEEYAALMATLNLPNPKMMDVAVPANLRQRLHQEEVARRGWAYSAAEAKALVGRPDVALIDLREKAERERYGAIPGALHAPYPELIDNIDEGGHIHELAVSGKTIVF